MRHDDASGQTWLILPVAVRLSQRIKVRVMLRMRHDADLLIRHQSRHHDHRSHQHLILLSTLHISRVALDTIGDAEDA